MKFKNKNKNFVKIFEGIIKNIKIIFLIIYIILIILIIQYKNLKEFNIKNLKELKYLKSIILPELKSTSFKYLKDKYYNFTNFNYSFSFVYNIIKVEYNIGILDEKKNIISPSDFTLYEDLHIFCYFEVINKNINIISLANIYNNEYFNCIEYFKINEKVKFGIKIVKNEITENVNLFHFTEKIFDYNKFSFINDVMFAPIHINYNHEMLVEMINNETLNKQYRLKSIYIKYPLPDIKRNIALTEGNWIFQNIYNHYFCFCKEKNCLSQNVSQICKLNFYKYIIDNNRYVYKKTDYLFIDFIFKELGEDDTYPVFKQMEKENSAHFMTEKSEIYEKYCSNQEKCIKIIYMDRILYKLYGDFIEKYLTLILKLKAVISAKENSLYILYNLYFNIEYITYIAVGHGLCYFKDFLYEENKIYGIKMNNKLLIPPSKILLNLVKKYGWKDKDLIKINLPRWDKFNLKSNDTFYLQNEGRIKNNSILIMFTWREMNSMEKISPYYFKNISDLITNKKLSKELKKKNVTLYFSMHRFLYFYNKEIFRAIQNNSNFIFINQNEISECLSKVDLVVTDFSSVIFDVMYRNKTFVIYFPDFDEPNIDIIYTQNYSYVIRTMKKNQFGFKNVYFNINETVNKIIHYVKNNFTIEKELKQLYDSFIPERRESIPKFIEYLKKLT